jgi:multisubunit Na+/H+ antiporter MnhE subunit
MLTLTLLLAVAWMALGNAYTPADLLVGLLFGFLVLRVSWRAFSSEPFSYRRYFGSFPANLPVMAWRWAKFIAFGMWEIVLSSVAVTRAVLAPRLRLQPGIVAVPLDIASDEGITTLATLITLTPGTVALDVSSDRRTLYIHAFTVSDVEALRRDIKRSFERRVKELWP